MISLDTKCFISVSFVVFSVFLIKFELNLSFFLFFLYVDCLKLLLIIVLDALSVKSVKLCI